MINTRKFALLFFTVFAAPYVMAAVKFEHYIFNYGNDHLYEVKLTDNTITWKSLSGPDKGERETDHIKKKHLTNEIDVIQWTENDGTFVTLTLDRKHRNVISSGKILENTWLWSGNMEVIP